MQQKNTNLSNHDEVVTIGKNIISKTDFLIEISIQVANKLSGVYTVIKSKAQEMKKYYGDNFYVVGPYIKKSADIEFEEKLPSGDIKLLIVQLKKEKIIVHYGRWLIPGSPKAFLIDFSGRLNQLPQIKKDIKSKYGIDLSKIKFRKKDIIGSGFTLKSIESEFVWGESINIFIQRLLHLEKFRTKNTVLHFHLSDPSGLMLYDLKKNNTQVGLVVTSHSTRLGRAIANNGEDINKEILLALKKRKTIHKGREKKYGGICQIRQYLELIYANCCDIFTSVSEVTAKESEYILGRKTDVITPNGLPVSDFPSLEDRAVIHIHAKNKIYRFLNAYFLPYYSIDVPESLLFFTSGRYELTTKGYDILFNALAKLNERLKKEEYPNTIFVFLFIMIENKRSNIELLENIAVYDAIEHLVSEQFPNIEKRVISSLVHGHELTRNVLFDEDFLIEAKKMMMKFKRERGNPPICAFRGLKKDDTVIKALIKCGLDNREDDKVKVIFYPAPVSVADGLLSMDYHEVIAGMQLGIFPSLYEPWGYTPLETAAQGVMAITTDVAGFGKFIQKHSDQRKKPGILTLNTENRKRNEIVDELADMMYWMTKLKRRERIEKKLEAHRLARLADWKEFAKYYIQAHNLAIERCKARQAKKKKQ